MKLIIFGIGRYYVNRRAELLELLCGDEIVAFIDNKATHQDYFENMPLYSPKEVTDLNFDAVLLMSLKNLEMREELLNLGIPVNKIMDFHKYKAEKRKGEIKLFIKEPVAVSNKKKVLFITTEVHYNGGSFAAIYAVMALKHRGYDVWLMAPSIYPKLFKEIDRVSINIAVCPALPYVSELDLCWIEKFDVILINVYQMIAAVDVISKVKPTIWWIHEPSDKYGDYYGATRCLYSEYADLNEFQNSYVIAVSNIAKQNFEKYYPSRVDSVLTLGIPDEADGLSVGGKNKLVFAIIGSVIKIKGQKIFIEAARRILTENYSVEFLIVGYYGEDEYSKELRDSTHDTPQIKFTGNLTRVKLKAAFKDIDVVVCASLEETMSLTMIEGMMHGKVCITTDATGIADYINDGENGFVCKAGDANSLYEKMKWVLNHRDELDVIKANARKTYEKYFTLDALADRLEVAFEAAEGKFLH